MVATGGGEDDENTLIFNITTHKSSSFSSSASTTTTTTTTTTTSTCSATTCSFSPVPFPRRTMEDVWNDINLSSFHHRRHHHHPTTTGAASSSSSSFRGFIFQDFLARGADAAGESLHPPCSSGSGLLLNLNSGPDDQLGAGARMPPATLDVPPFDHVLLASVDSAPALLGNNAGLRMNVPATDKSPGDRRHKRMIKNRESAARSRARKQAYTNELENEVERLKEENSRLRKQQQQLRNAAAAAQLPKKKTSLQRTSTAPF